MGKRKERRLAAQSAAGRRVKLDLFAEPSGELVGTSSHNEVGGDLVENQRASVPVSPSSSGKRQENPLLLLGQYSDDEIDTEENKSNAIADIEAGEKESNASANVGPSLPEQAEELPVAEVGASEGGSTAKVLFVDGEKEDSSDENIDPLGSAHYPVESDLNESEIIATTNPCNEATTQFGDKDASKMHASENGTSEWNIVMHEESNRYYYWNTVTGDTSWEVPAVLAHGAKTTTEEDLSLVDKREGSLPDVGPDFRSSNKDFKMDADVPTIQEPEPSTSLGVIGLCDDSKENCADGTGGHNLETEGRGNQEDRVLGYEANEVPNAITENEVPTEISIEAEKKHPIALNENHEGTGNDSVRLLKYCGSLLQRLKALEGIDDCWRSSCVLEVEIRLSDCRALSYCGSSLLPFWLHTETQLQKVESSICKEEASRLAKSKHTFEIGDDASDRVDDSLVKKLTTESEIDREDKWSIASSAENTHISPNNITLGDDSLNDGNLPGYSNWVVIGSGLEGHMEQGPIPKPDISGSDLTTDPPVEKTVTHSESPDGDIDMDVDMEVDDENLTTQLTNSGELSDPKYIAPPEDFGPPNQLSLEALPFVSVNEYSAPPPPEEDWIPPPPPDNEQIPPPPPDDPSLPPYPSSPPYAVHETVAPPLPYMEQYNLAYTVPSFQYYGPSVTEVINSNYYAHNDASLITETEPPFYEPVATAIPEAVPVIANPMEPVVYYEIPNGIPVGPVISSLEPSEYYGDPGSVSYPDNMASDHTGSVGVAPHNGSFHSLQVVSEMLPVSGEAEKAPMPVTSTSSVMMQGTVTASMTENTMVASTGAAPKDLSKVVRGKKRTIAVAPTLRSNKKVSTLVDKWKAAKEELHGNEGDDEPQNAYEILEKKRQKEIEEWRARQIASGEARDNANFQPLGGDWRERVKRKKAESTCDAVETLPEVVVSMEQQPDLAELSKNLPSGWQAYWDESSRNVYYGNALTLDTTWTRPTG